MNAAAREINQTTLFTGQFTEMKMSKQMCAQLVLLFLVLLSALAVVYITNLHRVTFSHYQLAQQQSHQLELQWGQLLLEQASLVTPSRIEQMAAAKLHMVLPATKQTYILRAQ